MSDRQVTVGIKVNQPTGTDKPFKDMASAAKGASAAVKDLADKSRAGFDGVSQSIRLSQASMDRFAASVKAGADAKGRFAKFGTAAAGAPGGGGGGMSIGVNQTLEAFEKIARSGNDVAGAFALLEGRLGDASKAFEKGFLGPKIMEGVGLMEAGGAWTAKKVLGHKTSEDAAKSKLAFLPSMSTARAGLEKQELARAVGRVTGAMQEQEKAQMDIQIKKGVEAAKDAIIQAERNPDAQRALIGQERVAATDALKEAQGRVAAEVRGQSGIPAGTSAREAEAMRAEKAMKLDTALAKQEAAQKRLVDLAQKEKEIVEKMGKERIAAAEGALKANQQQLAIAQQELAQAKAMREGAAAEFGGLDKGKQQQALKLAEKLAAGQQLNRGEMAAAGQFGFLQGQVRDQQIKAAENNPQFAALMKNLGIDQKIGAAQERAAQLQKIEVELTQKLEAEVKIDAQTTATQLAEQLMPALKQALDLATQRMQAQIEAEFLKRAVASRVGGG